MTMWKFTSIYVISFQRVRESTSIFCRVCRLNYKDNNALRLHLVKAMCSDRTKGDMEENGQFGCHRCDSVFSERPSLIRHLLFQCSQKHDLVCNKCRKMFATDDEFTQHIMTCVMRSVPLNPVMSRSGVKLNNIACQMCGSTFPNQRGFTMHARQCKAKPVHISPQKVMPEVEHMEKFGLTPCTVKLDKVSNVLGGRLPTGRVRRTPRKYADEAFERGWADTRDVKPDCTLQTTKPKPGLQYIPLSSASVLQAFAQLSASNKVQQSTAGSGAKLVVPTGGAVKGKPVWKVVSVTSPKGKQPTASTSKDGEATVTEPKVEEQMEATAENEEKDATNTDDPVTISLDDSEMMADFTDNKETMSASTEEQDMVLSL